MVVFVSVLLEISVDGVRFIGCKTSVIDEDGFAIITGFYLI